MVANLSEEPAASIFTIQVSQVEKTVGNIWNGAVREGMEVSIPFHPHPKPPFLMLHTIFPAWLTSPTLKMEAAVPPKCLNYLSDYMTSHPRRE
jgi:hypothetical protein